jgi:hypothetical protein
MMKRFPLIAFVCGFLALGCKAPDHALYTSPNRDFQCDVPWAWNVMYDSEDKHFTNLTFIGPYEPRFYLGAPSFSVRWYTRYATHRLRDGSLEMYSGPDDYIKQTLDSVYGPDRRMEVPVHEVDVAGRKIKHFVVVAAGPADAKATLGLALDPETGKTINPRKHAYAVIPMPSGFYVLIYPATKQGYDSYYKQFDRLVKSFVPFKDGPGGSPLPQPSQMKFK